MSSIPPNAYLQISVPVFPNEGEYYCPISVPISITNVFSAALLVDTIELEVQTDAGMVNRFINTPCAHRVEAGAIHDEIITFEPTPEFMENTCKFKVLVRFREVHNAAVGNQLAQTASEEFYIINRQSDSDLGQLFISLKQLADEDLADLFALMARRAGFDPYTAKDDPQPGTNLWDKIENALRNSKAVIGIWTTRTQMGQGVEREIELCKRFRIPMVLLIDQDVEVPEQFKTDIEYQTFNRNNPASAFSQVLTTRREVALSTIS
jgi:hypothetical protein